MPKKTEPEIEYAPSSGTKVENSSQAKGDFSFCGENILARKNLSLKIDFFRRIFSFLSSISFSLCEVFSSFGRRFSSQRRKKSPNDLKFLRDDISGGRNSNVGLLFLGSGKDYCTSLQVAFISTFTISPLLAGTETFFNNLI